jgi:hypothetical protein
MPSTEPTRRTAALAVLGLPDSATEAQIAGAYRRLARATHPDATGRTDPAAAREFVTVHAAYRLLAERPAPGSAQPSRPPGEPGKEPTHARARPPLTRLRVSVMPVRPPIVAGPVVVTPPRERDRPHRRRSR